MTRARSQQICCQETPYYHCISRVVRRAFLCGFDQASQKDYEYRRQWLLDRLTEIDAVYCIDVCAYAIMSNHYHLVLYINKEQVEGLSDLEVIERWRKIYAGPDIIKRYLAGNRLNKAQHQLITEIVAQWRERLASISWFMRSFNEHIARKANAEDCCKGHFWESRFKSQALLDEQALLTCMAYVELNPIRANMADRPETSDFTSIKQRIDERKQVATNTVQLNNNALILKKFLATGEELNTQIPYHFNDYLALVDWSGRVIRQDKRGAIDDCLPSILTRLGIDAVEWHKAMQPKGAHQYSHAIGCCNNLREYAKRLSIRWIKGISMSSKLFPV